MVAAFVRAACVSTPPTLDSETIVGAGTNRAPVSACEMVEGVTALPSRAPQAAQRACRLPPSSEKKRVAFRCLHFSQFIMVFPFGVLIFIRKKWCLWLKKSKKTPSYGYFTPPRAQKRSQYDGAENFLHLWGGVGMRGGGFRFIERKLGKELPTKKGFWSNYIVI